MDVMQAMEEINKQKSIPVIYVTASDDQKALQRLNTASNYKIVAKPYSYIELKEVIDEFI